MKEVVIKAIETLTGERVGNIPKAQEIVFNAFYRRLISFAYQRTNDYEISEEIASQAIQKAFMSASKFEGEKSCFSSWLYNITKNLVIDHYRSKSYQKSKANDSLENMTFVESTSEGREKLEIECNEFRADMFVVAEEKKNLFQKFINSISNEKVRNVIQMRYEQELKYQEIADITNLPMGSVKSMIRRGVKQLQKELA